MNKQWKAIAPAMALAMVLSVVPPAGAHAQADPIQTVKTYVDTANSGDLAKTLAFYADDAVVKNPLGVFVGKAAIAKWLAQDVQTTRAAPKTWEMKGPLVINTGVVALDRFAKAGVPYVDYRSEYIVSPDGKIRFFAPAPMPTPEQAAKVQPPDDRPMMNPIKVAQDYVKAANKGNINAAQAFFAPDAAALLVNGSRLLSGKDQIGAWLKDDVQTTRATPAEWQILGNTVVNTGTVSLTRFKNLGIDPVPYRAEYVIQDGKIRFFRPTVTLTPEQQAKMVAATTLIAPFSGTWAGQMQFSSEPPDYTESIEVDLPDACIAGGVCGQIHNLTNGCVWQMTLNNVQDKTLSYTFSKSLEGDCPAGSSGVLQITPDGRLLRKHTTPDFVAEGALTKKP